MDSGPEMVSRWPTAAPTRLLQERLSDLQDPGVEPFRLDPYTPPPFTCSRARLVTLLEAVKYDVKGGVLVEGDMRRWRPIHVRIQRLQSHRARSVTTQHTPKFEMFEAVM